MKLPRTTRGPGLRPMPREDTRPTARVEPRTYDGTSKGWDHHSLSNTSGSGWTKSVEQTTIETMVKNSDSSTLAGYAASSECGVYARTGIHTSSSDSQWHVQVILGKNSDPWYSSSCPKRTCHVRYVLDKNGKYQTQCWDGWPSSI